MNQVLSLALLFGLVAIQYATATIQHHSNLDEEFEGLDQHSLDDHHSGGQQQQQQQQQQVHLQSSDHGIGDITVQQQQQKQQLSAAQPLTKLEKVSASTPDIAKVASSQQQQQSLTSNKVEKPLIPRNSGPDYFGGLSSLLNFGAKGDVKGGSQYSDGSSSSSSLGLQLGIPDSKVLGEWTKLFYNPIELCKAICNYYNIPYDKFFGYIGDNLISGIEPFIAPSVSSFKIIEKVFVPDACRLGLTCRMGGYLSHMKERVLKISPNSYQGSSYIKAMIDGLGGGNCESLYSLSSCDLKLVQPLLDIADHGYSSLGYSKSKSGAGAGYSGSDVRPHGNYGSSKQL